MSMGCVILHCQSSKKNLNTKKSTEDKLIVTSEYVPFNVYMVMFLDAQGYEIKNNIVLQDNQITIRMENNGSDSCTVNSSNVNIRRLFVKDRVDKGEIEVSPHD